ncbi:MAG: response regulator [Muribaculaceae bacterium]|nr:response regulator [Muribaculaceae bacterium]
MKLLIIDDNMAVRTTLKLVLAKEFDEIVTVGDPKLIPALLQAGNVDVVLLDMNFDNTKLDCSDGLFWLERIKQAENAPAVVVITAFGDVEIAVEAMKLGAEDFVTKPWDNERLIEKLRRAVELNLQRRRDGMAAKRVKEMEQAQREREHMTLDEVKLRHIRSVIDRCGGNLSAASEQLGINRQTLYNMMKKM